MHAALGLPANLVSMGQNLHLMLPPISSFSFKSGTKCMCSSTAKVEAGGGERWTWVPCAFTISSCPVHSHWVPVCHGSCPHPAGFRSPVSLVYDNLRLRTGCRDTGQCKLLPELPQLYKIYPIVSPFLYHGGSSCLTKP